MALNFKRIGLQIQQLRKRYGLSQQELADITGLSPSYISHIETAIKKASLSSIVSICDALEVSVDQLLRGNQAKGSDVYKNELVEIFSDCNDFERGVICDICLAIKKSLREHADLYPQDTEWRW